MSLNANRGRLIGATKDLFLKWEETQTHWKDVKSQQFGKQYMEPLLQHINKAVAVCEKLDQLITQVKVDCE